MGARQVLTFVCAVVVIDGVVVAVPFRAEISYEGHATTIESDGAEIIETTGEPVDALEGAS